MQPDPVSDQRERSVRPSMALARTREGATAPVRALRSLPELPPGCVFHPDGRCLLKRYLLPMALGRVPDEPYRGFVAEGVDVCAVRPEALPFPRCNRGLHGMVWDYYFTTRPAAAGAGGGSGSGVAGGGGGDGDDDDDVRVVAAGGCWRRYGAEKEYVGEGDDEEVYGSRRRFAFHEAGDPGEKTVWRMKEFRLNEAPAPAPPASRGRGGVVFHPSAKGLVIWKVYNEVIPAEEPAVDYYNIDGDDDDEEEIGAVVITVGDAAAAAAATTTP